MRRVASTITVLVMLVLAAPAGATVFSTDSSDASRYAALVDRAAEHAPVPPFLRVREEPCPTWPDARGCYDGYTVYLHVPEDRVFLHELGHAADYWTLRPSDRDAYRPLLSLIQPQWSWLGGAYGTPQAGEWFAESYADCAIDQFQPRAGEHAYGYVATPEEHARVCAWLDHLAHPPVVPAPPPAPPLADAPRPKKVCKRHRLAKRCRMRVAR